MITNEGISFWKNCGAAVGAWGIETKKFGIKRVDEVQITTVQMYAIPLSITGNTWVWGNSDELKELRFYRSPRTENV